jgi:hypothetical protein
MTLPPRAKEDPMPVAAPSHDDDTFYGFLDPDPRYVEGDDPEPAPARDLDIVVAVAFVTGVVVALALMLWQVRAV